MFATKGTLALRSKPDISTFFLLSMCGMVLGPMDQIGDSEADQTDDVNACAVFSESHSFDLQWWLKGSEWQE